jgi:hypothetical protein
MSHELRDAAFMGLEWSCLFLCECFSSNEAAALSMLDERRAQLPVMGRRSSLGSWLALLAVIEGLALLGRRETAGELYPLALEAVGTGTVVDQHAIRLTQTVAGIAAAAGEKWEQAESHYQTALRQAHEIPFVSEQPEVRRFYAQMLLERGAPGDRERARAMLEEAIVSYRKIGMPRHVEMAEGLIAKA